MRPPFLLKRIFVMDDHRVIRKNIYSEVVFENVSFVKFIHFSYDMSLKPSYSSKSVSIVVVCNIKNTLIKYLKSGHS